MNDKELFEWAFGRANIPFKALFTPEDKESLMKEFISLPRFPNMDLYVFLHFPQEERDKLREEKLAQTPMGEKLKVSTGFTEGEKKLENLRTEFHAMYVKGKVPQCYWCPDISETNTVKILNGIWECVYQSSLYFIDETQRVDPFKEAEVMAMVIEGYVRRDLNNNRLSLEILSHIIDDRWGDLFKIKLENLPYQSNEEIARKQVEIKKHFFELLKRIRQQLGTPLMEAGIVTPVADTDQTQKGDYGFKNMDIPKINDIHEFCINTNVFNAAVKQEQFHRCIYNADFRAIYNEDDTLKLKFRFVIYILKRILFPPPKKILSTDKIPSTHVKWYQDAARSIKTEPNKCSGAGNGLPGDWISDIKKLAGIK